MPYGPNEDVNKKRKNTVLKKMQEVLDAGEGIIIIIGDTNERVRNKAEDWNGAIGPYEEEKGCGLGARRVFVCGECRDSPDVLSTFKKLGCRPAESDRVLESNSGNARPPTGPELLDGKQAAWTEAPGTQVEQYLNSGRRVHFEKSQEA
ncbi:hypothetical protein FQA39_LY01575 [Lamprigera yunnana]|nr:hypothetical protein FQA39_LY01575 [Lamprigera yunnana]